MTDALVQEGPRRYGLIAPTAPKGEFELDLQVPGKGPLELDIGFGRGQSIFTRAQASPNSRIIGIEIKSKWAFKVHERVQRLETQRITIWAGDAREIIKQAKPLPCLQNVFVHFPDPWWKKRHQKRRVLGFSFLDFLAPLLIHNAALFVQTDVLTRHQLYTDLLNKHKDFVVVDDRLDHNPFGAISNRETRAEEDGLPIYRLLARKLHAVEG